MDNFELKYIDTKNAFYKEAVRLRESLFFKGMKNSRDLIQDDFESKAIHLVCLNGDEVVGTGRLNIINEVGVISQMAIKESHQKRGIGANLLKALITKSKGNKVKNIELSARETALTFYEKFGFVTFGNKYPSQKTQVIHQKMKLIIK